MPAVWEIYFQLWKYKFPWICTDFCPSLVAQLVECLARANGPRLKSRVLQNVITNDFIIFDFSLLKLKFQEIDLKICLA